MLNVEKLIEGVHDYIGRALAPFAARVKALEDRAPERGEKGERGESIKGDRGDDGKDAIVDYERIGAAIKEVVSVAVNEIPKPNDGKDGKDGASVHPDTVARMVREAVDAMPRTLAADGRDGKDGKDGRDGKDADPAIIAALITEGVAQALPVAVQRALDAMMPDIIAKAAEAVPRPHDGKDGADGKDADPVDTGAIVRAVVASIPAPRDGRDAPPVDIDAVVAKAIALIPVPKDGADGVSVTLDDLRPVLEAETARWQLEFERRATDTLQRAIDNAPKPANGKDGQDGLSPDDFEVALDGRTFTFALRCGDRLVKREIKVPFPMDKGVYRSGMKAEHGDVVTFGGSQWIAVKDTHDKPPSDSWRLQVRRGQDGKDASP